MKNIDHELCYKIFNDRVINLRHCKPSGGRESGLKILKKLFRDTNRLKEITKEIIGIWLGVESFGLLS